MAKKKLSAADQAKRDKALAGARATGYTSEEEQAKPLPPLYESDPKLRAIGDILKQHPSLKKVVPNMDTLYNLLHSPEMTTRTYGPKETIKEKD